MSTASILTAGATVATDSGGQRGPQERADRPAENEAQTCGDEDGPPGHVSVSWAGAGVVPVHALPTMAGIPHRAAGLARVDRFANRGVGLRARPRARLNRRAFAWTAVADERKRCIGVMTSRPNSRVLFQKRGRYLPRPAHRRSRRLHAHPPAALSAPFGRAAPPSNAGRGLNHRPGAGCAAARRPKGTTAFARPTPHRVGCLTLPRGSLRQTVEVRDKQG